MKTLRRKQAVATKPIETTVVVDDTPAVAGFTPLPAPSPASSPNKPPAPAEKGHHRFLEFIFPPPKPKPKYETLIIRKPEYGGLEDAKLFNEVGIPRECVWDKKARYLAVSQKPRKDYTDLVPFESSDYAIKANEDEEDIKKRENDGFYPGELWEPIVGWKRAHVAFAPDKTWMEKFSPWLGIGALGIGFITLLVFIDFLSKR